MHSGTVLCILECVLLLKSCWYFRLWSIVFIIKLPQFRINCYSIYSLYIYIYIYTHTCCHHLPSPLYCLGQSCFPLPRFAWCLLAHAASFHLIHLRHVILKIQGCYPLTLPDVLTLHLRIKRKLKWANFIVWTVV